MTKKKWYRQYHVTAHKKKDEKEVLYVTKATGPGHAKRKIQALGLIVKKVAKRLSK